MFAKEIKRFIEIVDKGSLNLAAKNLKISQPAISNSVKILEKKYNKFNISKFFSSKTLLA